MCGVLAIVSSRDGIDEATRRIAERMTQSMARRGPDGSGLLVRDNVVLGHRRLAIRDIDAGQQPMQTADGRFAISYNGELYNDAELRDELSSQHGVTFQTQCDTETVLQAFAIWGEDCVTHLRGMFAFIAVDFLRERVVLARDRCGVKPLFFAAAGSTFVAASSVDALLRHPDVAKRPNFRAVSHYLSSLRLTLGRETLFGGVYQVQPGERLIWRAGGRIRIESYWELPEEAESIPFEHACETLQQELDEAVRIRQVSDRPVGMLLSGGVDSATIATSMSQERGSFHARTAGEEVSGARETAGAVGCEVGAVAMQAERYRECWRELAEETSLPCSTPSDPVILALSRSLKSDVDVALGGEGADELLCGYAAQHWLGEDFRRHTSAAIRRTDHAHSSEELLRSHLSESNGRAKFRSPAEMFLACNGLVPQAAKPKLLSQDAWRDAEEDAAILPIYEAAAGTESDESPSRQIYRLIHRINLEGQLSRLDTATMQASLEARVPFTDHVLCEQMATVPFNEHIRIRRGEHHHRTASELAEADALRTKRVLRAVARRRLPVEIAERRKQSFPTPVAEWLTGPWAAEISRKLCGSPFVRELIRTEALAELVIAPERAGMMLWPIVNLADWGDRQFAA